VKSRCIQELGYNARPMGQDVDAFIAKWDAAGVS
jgi:hypothetical protein